MKKIAFIFPGQGAQEVGMGKELCEKYEVARETFAQANEALGFDLKKICFEGPIQELTKTKFTQPAILTHSIAVFRVLAQELGITPQYSAGHSLGEYSALVAAGSLDFTDAVRLVHKRGQLMQEAVPVGVGSMMAVMKLNPEDVYQVCQEVSTEDQIVSPANYNSDSQIVISGHKSAVEKAGKRLSELGGYTKELNVSAPFHSPLMQPAADKMLEELKQVDFRSPEWPVIANVTALPYKGTDKMAEILAEQIVSPVRWHESVAYMDQANIEHAVEVGPGKVLKGILKRSYPQIQVISLGQGLSFDELKEELDLKQDLNKIVTRSMAHAVSTRNRNFDDEAYQKGVVQPYREMEKLKSRLDNEETEPTLEEARQVLENLKLIFETKGVPAKEQVKRFKQLFEESQTRDEFADFELPSVG